jgi:flagellar hook protein FlgE
MSIIGAFIAGVTGINAQSEKMGAISDNISNANTVGYKPNEVLFKTLVIPTGAPTALGSTGPVPFNFAPGGVIPQTRQRLDLQGLLQSSSSATDIGILGRGFLPVTDQVNTTTGAVASGANLAVTRAGAFSMDKNGFFTNSAGFFLEGVTAGSSMPQTLAGLVPVQVDPGPSVAIAGVATSNIRFSGNLPASAAIGTQGDMTVGVFDGTGNAYTLDVQFTKTALNTWSAQIASVTPAASGSTTTASISSSPMTISFGTNGQISSGGTGSLGSVTLSNGQTLAPSFDFVGTGAITATTQFDDKFAEGGAQQDGKSSGFRLGFQFDTSGTLSEVYSNGEVIPRYQIPVVTFPNDEGLEAMTGNAWLPTGTSALASGAPAINVSNTGGAGQITPSTLESSSVDLSEEFSQMIVTQTTYNANSKTITVADEMYSTAVGMKR